jgi:hypothetical protein
MMMLYKNCTHSYNDCMCVNVRHDYIVLTITVRDRRSFTNEEFECRLGKDEMVLYKKDLRLYFKNS